MEKRNRTALKANREEDTNGDWKESVVDNCTVQWKESVEDKFRLEGKSRDKCRAEGK